VVREQFSQKPVPLPVSMQTPENRLPAEVTRVAATSPETRSSTGCGLSTAAAFAMSVSASMSTTCPT
jgi:hypothetical protein